MRKLASETGATPGFAYAITSGLAAAGPIVDLAYFMSQAEDGIRDHCVTGVQTCALPISPGRASCRSVRPRAICRSAPVPSSEDADAFPGSVLESFAEHGVRLDQPVDEHPVEDEEPRRLCRGHRGRAGAPEPCAPVDRGQLAEELAW